LDKNIINKCIEIAFDRYGYSAEISNGEVNFHPLNLRISGEISFFKDHENGIQIGLLIKTVHDDFFPIGVQEFSYGFAEDEGEAIIDAAYKWIISDFNTFHSLLCKHHDHSKDKLEMISLTPENELLGWEIIFGDILSPKTNHEKVITENNEFFVSMLDLITGSLLSEKGNCGLKFFAIKHKNETLNIDCRVNGHDWEDGKVALNKYASKWKSSDEVYWKKQYIIIVNKEIEEMKYKDNLLIELEQTLNKTNKEISSLEKKLSQQNKFNWRFWKKN
jgi:hypothetical protein